MLLLSLLVDVAEDIIENEISSGLLSKDEGLDELFEFGGFVGCFTDYLNNDIIEGALRVNVRDSDLAVLEIEFPDSLLDSL